jgi:glycerol-1-phosphate dehydrogenase [NAD(P)+]
VSAERLRRLLAGTLPDPDGPGTLAVPVRRVVIASGLTGEVPGLLDGLGLGRRLAVVTDPETRAAQGARVAAGLADVAQVTELVLPSRPHADMAMVARIRAGTAEADSLVAVGSGTINDLCKHAAHLDGKPYVVLGTAPSMNGYTSANAAITAHGHKQSLPATAPVAVLLDLDVLARAPVRLIRAGLGDSICRPTAQADWLLAHLLLGEPYRRTPFLLLEDDEDALLSTPEALAAGEPAAMELLARTLVMSGFGMTICGGSQPASQGEHLISHYLDMMGDAAWPESFHGEQIAVTTPTMARLQEAMLAGDLPRLAPTRPDEAAFRAHFGDETGASCWRAFARKRLDAARCEALNRRLADEWPAIRDAIRAVARPAARIEDVLRRAGAPTRPADLGWPAAAYRRAVLHARLIRDRFTFLDLAADSGRLEALVP